MKLMPLLIVGFCFLIGCINDNQKVIKVKSQNPIDYNQITCDRAACMGIYNGPEFIDGEDIAHQFSNQMAKAVGDQLKVLYEQQAYSQVDFANITMTTKGMGTGRVKYHLTIPFKAVKEKCEAYTAFDHVGGWNHKPALAKRKRALKKALMPGHQLKISALKTTPEGLQEYWIQWQHKVVQSDCQYTND